MKLAVKGNDRQTPENEASKSHWCDLRAVRPDLFRRMQDPLRHSSKKVRSQNSFGVASYLFLQLCWISDSLAPLSASSCQQLSAIASSKYCAATAAVFAVAVLVGLTCITSNRRFDVLDVRLSRSVTSG